jgi:hypothetical protein
VLFAAEALTNVVLGRDDIASTWGDQRWASYRLNTPD